MMELATKDDRLWHRVDELARRLARLERLAKETRRKVVAIEDKLGIRNTRYEDVAALDNSHEDG